MEAVSNAKRDGTTIDEGTKDELKKAVKTEYRQLSLAVHPDKLPEDHKANGTQNFQQLKATYEHLSAMLE